ncbi:MAG: sulfotransferase domain-containing protein [Lachnospiraceae bacterium]|nr:sulfotransferase domain-containing protein [Lachnospiraceae bacterium]
MGYPDFVCMGFQKCGTTTLYELLHQHPQIALCRDVKEPMYYRVPFISVLGFGKFYYRRRYFGHLKKGDPRLRGEVNAGLTFNGCAAKMRRNLSPDTKMIFMLRDPVERSYSAYKYFLARGFLPAEVMEDDVRLGHAAGFDRYVHSVLEASELRNRIMKKRLKYLVLSQSNYAACVEEYLPSFDRSNMKFVIFEEFVRDQHQSCRELYRFLGVEDAEGISYGLVVNSGNERAVSAKSARSFMVAKGVNYALYDFLAMNCWAPKLYRGFRRWYEKIREQSLIPDTDHSSLLSETRTYLREYFAEDVRRMEEITGRNLREIWKWENKIE